MLCTLYWNLAGKGPSGYEDVLCLQSTNQQPYADPKAVCLIACFDIGVQAAQVPFLSFTLLA